MRCISCQATMRVEEGTEGRTVEKLKYACDCGVRCTQTNSLFVLAERPSIEWFVPEELKASEKQRRYAAALYVKAYKMIPDELEILTKRQCGRLIGKLLDPERKLSKWNKNNKE